MNNYIDAGFNITDGMGFNCPSKPNFQATIAPDEFWNDTFQHTLHNSLDMELANLNKDYDLHTKALLYSKDTYQRLLKILELYIAPIIFTIGIIGNGVSFSVFIATHLKRNSCYIHLASLAVADTVFLICMFLSWGTVHLNLSVYRHHGSCQIFIYLTYISCFLSVWNVVAFTVERWFVTCYPLRKDETSDGLIAKKTVIILALVAAVGYSFSLFTHGISNFMGQSICAPFPEYSRGVFIVNMVDTVIILIIPTAIIISCNVRMSYIIYKFQKQSGILNGSINVQKWNFNRCSTIEKISARKSILSGRYNTRNKLNISRSSHMRATRMLIIVSTVFLVCNVPSHAAKTYGFIMTCIDQSYVPGANFLLTQKLFHMFYYVNFAVNFFLYSFTSQSFRAGLIRLYIKIKTKVSRCKCKKDKKLSSNIPCY